MADVLAEHLTLDTQVKLYRGTVLNILKKGGDELPLDVDEQVWLVRLTCMTDATTSHKHSQLLVNSIMLRVVYGGDT